MGALKRRARDAVSSRADENEQPGRLLSPGKGAKLSRMKAIIASFVVCLATIAFAADEKPQMEVYFSPGGGCTSAIANTLTSARSNILVQAYSFTYAPIAKALVDAHKRGVRVEVILDASQRTEKHSSADFIRNAGVRCLIDDKHAKAHNKIMVVDGETVITGSFNFIKAAEEKNSENLLIIHDPVLAAKYSANWAQHAGHSLVYTGKPK